MNYIDYQNWKRWDSDTFGNYSNLDAAYFLSELKRTTIDVIKEIYVYEIGFGNGSFAGYAQSLGFKYFGSEINQTLVERGRKFGISVYENGIKEVISSEGSETFDLVVAFDVLEHLEVEDIISFLFVVKILHAQRCIAPRERTSNANHLLAGHFRVAAATTHSIHVATPTSSARVSAQR